MFPSQLRQAPTSGVKLFYSIIIFCRISPGKGPKKELTPLRWGRREIAGSTSLHLERGRYLLQGLVFLK